MVYPRRLLNDGEDVVVDVRPHWTFMTGPIVITALVVAGAIAVAVEVGRLAEWTAIAIAVVIGLSVCWLGVRYARWATTRLVVTTHRVVNRCGVLAHRTREIPIERINDLTVHQSLTERLVRRGTLVVESGAEGGQEVFVAVAEPAAVQQVIHMQLDRRARAPHPASASIPDQIRQLDDLYRRGTISADQFESKKAELLGRI